MEPVVSGTDEDIKLAETSVFVVGLIVVAEGLVLVVLTSPFEVSKEVDAVESAFIVGLTVVMVV